MTAVARISAALTAALTAVGPAIALAQGIADPAPTTTDRGFGWLWLLAAALVLFALFRMFFSRDRRAMGGRRP